MAQFDCFKCGGSGKVSFRHIENGDCFQCGATGKLSYQPRAKVEADPHPELLWRVRARTLDRSGVTGARRAENK